MVGKLYIRRSKRLPWNRNIGWKYGYFKHPQTLLISLPPPHQSSHVGEAIEIARQDPWRMEVQRSLHLDKMNWGDGAVKIKNHPRHLVNTQNTMFNMIMYDDNILVGGWVDLPLWKIWLRQLGWLFIPNIWENKKCSKPPTRWDLLKWTSTDGPFLILHVSIHRLVCWIMLIAGDLHLMNRAGPKKSQVSNSSCFCLDPLQHGLPVL